MQIINNLEKNSSDQYSEPLPEFGEIKRVSFSAENGVIITSINVNNASYSELPKKFSESANTRNIFKNQLFSEGTNHAENFEEKNNNRIFSSDTLDKKNALNAKSTPSPFKETCTKINNLELKIPEKVHKNREVEGDTAKSGRLDDSITTERFAEANLSHFNSQKKLNLNDACTKKNNFFRDPPHKKNPEKRSEKSSSLERSSRERSISRDRSRSSSITDRSRSNDSQSTERSKSADKSNSIERSSSTDCNSDSLDETIIQKCKAESERIREKNNLRKMTMITKGIVNDNEISNRVHIKKKLTGLYNSIIKITFGDSNRKLVFNQYGDITHKLLPDKLSHLEISCEHIYAIMLDSIFHNVYYFLTEEGFVISLLDLKKLIVKKYAPKSSPLLELINHRMYDHFQKTPLYNNDPTNPGEASLITLLQTLPFPEKMNINFNNTKEKICLRLLQRIYPLRTLNQEEVPIIPPLTFLCSYKSFVDTSLLFKFIAELLKLPSDEMPHLQKMRVLNICQNWFESNLYMKDKYFIKNEFLEIIQVCKNLKNVEINNYCEEIKWSFQLKEPKYSPNKKEFSTVESFFTTLFTGMCDEETMKNFVELAAKDIKTNAALSICNISPLEFKEQKDKTGREEEFEIFYNRIVNFVIATHEKYVLKVGAELKKDSPKATHASETNANEALKESVSQNKFNFASSPLTSYLEFFISLAYRLAKNNDFFSSFAIHNALTKINIDKYFAEKMNAPKFDKFFRKLKLSDDVDEAPCLMKHLYLSKLFMTDQSFHNLNQKIAECRAEEVYYIPQIALLKSKVLHGMDKIELSARNACNINSIGTQEKIEEKDINFSTLHEQSNLILWVNAMLQEMRYHLYKEFERPQVLNTDIVFEILRETESRGDI